MSLRNSNIIWKNFEACFNRIFWITIMTIIVVGCLGQDAENSRESSIEEIEKPNIIIIFVDNLGYGDIEPFGSELHRTPNLNRMADEGNKLTHFYVSAGVCTPSRASIMTGSYPRRVNLHVDSRGGNVLRPVEPIGLHPDEITIARILKDAGYTTAAIGKWHLGDQDPFLPTRHGFDYYHGVPYSDDMTRDVGQRIGRDWPELPLMRNETVIEQPVDRDFLTQKETAEAIRFIEENKEDPFFLYLPQAMPGSTTAPFASPAFRGKSKNGAWGDSVEELDWSAGMILKTLRRLGLENNTLVIWTSDNGAPTEGRDPSLGVGSNAPLAGSGYTTQEGGMRVPAIVWWPGVVPPGATNEELATTMDLYVTLGNLAGAEIPQDRIIDGKDIFNLFLNKPGASTPHEAFYYFHGPQLQAVRSGPWKLYLSLENNMRLNRPQEVKLYNVVTDPGETNNVAEQHPDVIAQINTYAEVAREDLGDVGREGTGQRPVGRVENPTPRMPPCCDLED